MNASRSTSSFRVVKTRGGARLMEGGLVLSEIVSTPGPTDSLFDVLAACVAALVPGTRVAILGFAGGGLVAPLRAMGFAHPIHAVDLSLEGERVFREHSGPWVGDVRVAQADALRWLRRRKTPWDLILEDLSTDTELGVTKPPVSLDPLPALMAAHVKKTGVAATNVLPVPGIPWNDLLATLAAPWRHALVVHLDEYENRILIGSQHRLDARGVSRTLRRHLEAIGSDQHDTLSVRTFR